MKLNNKAEQKTAMEEKDLEAEVEKVAQDLTFLNTSSVNHTNHPSNNL